MIANLLSKLEMSGGRTIKLVRERPEKTIAVSYCRGGVQSKERKLGRELSGGRGGFCEELCRRCDSSSVWIIIRQVKGRILGLWKTLYFVTVLHDEEMGQRRHGQ